MKTLVVKMVSLLFLMVGGIAAMGQQDRQTVPGDDFSLEGALELFKQSASPEEFERLLNSANSKVNNLDLNGDGEIDYIRVIDRNEGNVHVFIMQAVLSPTDRQDVAVIELEKLANGKAVLQITGDEDVYGIETIIEPTQEVRVNAGTSTNRTVVNVWTWPSVQYVYSPYYTVWVSPWHWYSRPVWWYSWRPVTYYEYYSYWQPYRYHYSNCHTHRIVYARNMYRPHRTYSSAYYNRHHQQIARYRSTYRDDRNRRDFDNDRNRSTNYTDDRTSRSRYDVGNNDREHKPTQRTSTVVRQKTTSSEDRMERSNMNTRTQKEIVPTVERKSTVKRSEPVYTNRSEDRTKPIVSERSSQPRQERPTVNQSRGSQPREVRSIDRLSDSGKSSGGGEKQSGNSRGSGKRSN
jgi:hypothetical protein